MAQADAAREFRTSVKPEDEETEKESKRKKKLEDIKPTLLTPDVVALMWSVSVKKVYEYCNTDQLPYVLFPSKKGDGKRDKRLIRIRRSVAESWILEHEVGGEAAKDPVKSPRRRQRSILGPARGLSVIKPLKNGSNSASETTENL